MELSAFVAAIWCRNCTGLEAEMSEATEWEGSFARRDFILTCTYVDGDVTTGRYSWRGGRTQDFEHDCTTNFVG